MRRRTGCSRSRSGRCRRTRMRCRSIAATVRHSFIAPHPVLALGKTRYVGEPVAVVVAETSWQAMDAAERLAFEYAPLPAVTRSADALAPGAALVWEEHGTNLCVDSE